MGSSQPLPKQSSCTNSGTSMWTYNTGTWYSGDATQVTLGVRNFGDGGFGNDLAIDQLSFTESATATATATVSVVTTPSPTPTPTTPTTNKFDCGGTGIYDLNGKTWLFPQLDTTNATLASVADKFTNAPPVSGTSIPANALAINVDGTKAYATSTGTKSVFMYNAADGTTTRLGAFTDASGAMPDGSTIMGAINPVNGWYYVGFALYDPTDTVPKTARIDFYAWDPVTGNKGLQFYLSVPIDANDGYNMQGDLAFDSEGRAYIVNGIQRDAYILDTQGKRVSNPEAYWENVITIVDAVPSNGSRVVASRTIPLDWTEGPFNGIAFGGDGFLYVQSALYDGKTNYLSKVDPSTGAVGAPQVITDPVGTTNADGTVTPVAAGTTAKAQYNTDLASCSYPSTLKLQKDIVGRTGLDDQFKLSILGTEAKSDGTFPTIASGTTFGSTLGVQSATEAVAGAVSGVPGREYTLQESAVNADLADYVATWECVDTARKEADGSPVSVPVTVGEGGTASVTMPSPPAPTGSHVVCTVTNTPEAEEPVLETAVPITVEKKGLNCDTNESTCPLYGAEFALYDKDPSVAGATPIDDGITVSGTDGSIFTSKALKNGTYWLVETKAPTGHTLLATPVQFNMCTFVQGAAPATCLTGNGGAAPTEGITLVGTTSPLVTVVNDTTNQVFKMVVSDPTASPLPQAGGSGPWESVVIALLLMGAAATSYRFTSGRRLATRSR